MSDDLHGQLKEKTVLVIFKTHLDVGFTDSATNVIRKYFNEFIINAVKTADFFRVENSGRRYVWTVGSWLLYEYFESANAADKKFLEDAVIRGEIVWHALPFTSHSELADPSLFRYGISLSRELDRRFGKMTIAAKLTDVPGHTRGIIAPLVDAGVKLLHIGVNPACKLPDVPPIFNWEDSHGNRLLVVYQKDYGDTMSLSNMEWACHLSVTGDNSGPHQPTAAQEVFADLERRFPHAAIQAGTFDDLARLLLPQVNYFPVIKAEIGDTWIHGVGTDPTKVRQFKALCRLRTQMEKRATPEEFRNFSRSLLQVTEHTWGMDEKTWLPGECRSLGEDFQTMLRTRAAKRFAASWQEKRELITAAVDKLTSVDLKREANSVLRSVIPRRPTLSGWKQTSQSRFQGVFFDFGFDLRRGSLNRLTNRRSGTVIADRNHRLGEFSVRNYNRADYNRFLRQYLRAKPDWAILDFSKPFLPKGLSKITVGSEPATLYRRQQKDADLFLLHRQLISDGGWGYPENVYIEYRFSRVTPQISVKVSWFDKEVSRLPHGIWFSFTPLRADNWQFDKMGEMISPNEVVSNGGRSLHAINENVFCSQGDTGINIRSLDAPLVAPGKPALLDFSNRQPELDGGIHFNLYNNVWGTNFPMWNGDDAMFRFELHQPCS